MQISFDSPQSKLKQWSKTILNGFINLGYNIEVYSEFNKQDVNPVFLSILDKDTCVSYDFKIKYNILNKNYNLNFHRFIIGFLRKENSSLASNFSSLVKKDRRNRKKINQLSRNIIVSHQILEYQNLLFLGDGGFSVRYNLKDKTTVMNYCESEYEHLTKNDFSKTYYHIFKLNDYFTLDDFLKETEDCLTVFKMANY